MKDGYEAAQEVIAEDLRPRYRAAVGQLAMMPAASAEESSEWRAVRSHCREVADLIERVSRAERLLAGAAPETARPPNEVRLYVVVADESDGTERGLGWQWAARGALVSAIFQALAKMRGLRNVRLEPYREAARP